MIKELATRIVITRRYDNKTLPLPEYVLYIIHNYHTVLLNQLHNIRVSTPNYQDSDRYLKFLARSNIIKDEDSFILLKEECHKILLMKSLQEIL